MSLARPHATASVDVRTRRRRVGSTSRSPWSMRLVQARRCLRAPPRSALPSVATSQRPSTTRRRSAPQTHQRVVGLGAARRLGAQRPQVLDAGRWDASRRGAVARLRHRVDAGQHQHRVHPGRHGPGDVGVEPVPHRQHLSGFAGPGAAAQSVVQRRVRLADDDRVAVPVAGWTAATRVPLPGAVPRLVGRVDVGVGGDPDGARRHGIRGLGQVARP